MSLGIGHCKSVFESKYRFGFTGENVDKVLAIDSVDDVSFRSSSQMVNVGDVFAPYPFRKSKCNFLPSTNGAACGETLEFAIENALSEALERSSIMKFWYLGDRDCYFRMDDQRFDIAAHPAFVYLKELGYQVYLTCCLSGPPVTVLVFCIHPTENYPFSFCSAGTKKSMRESIDSALCESVQTLVALSNISSRVVDWIRKGLPLSGLDSHMYYYSVKSQSEDAAGSFLTELRTLDDFNLGHLDEGGEKSLIGVFSDAIAATAVDLTPDFLSNELAVCKVHSEHLLPLFVGEKLLPAEIAGDNRMPYPHPFP